MAVIELMNKYLMYLSFIMGEDGMDDGLDSSSQHLISKLYQLHMMSDRVSNMTFRTIHHKEW